MEANSGGTDAQYVGRDVNPEEGMRVRMAPEHVDKVWAAVAIQ